MKFSTLDARRSTLDEGRGVAKVAVMRRSR
jgi:hypothetical protein